MITTLRNLLRDFSLTVFVIAWLQQLESGLRSFDPGYVSDCKSVGERYWKIKDKQP